MKQIKKISQLIAISLLVITMITIPILEKSSTSKQDINIGITTLSDQPEKSSCVSK